MTTKYRQLNRRQFIQALGATAMGVTGLAAFPGFAHAQGRKNALLIGLDIGDSITFDPARLAQYSSPMTVHNAYDTLVTMTRATTSTSSRISRPAGNIGPTARPSGSSC